MRLKTEINMERKKIVFIVNPKSGTLGKTNWIAISTKLLAQEFDLEFQYTTHRGHACELAQKAAANKVAIVAAVGGDGTVNEIASALIHTDT
jgi:diacylglycerol kinase family enzyme